MFCIPFSGFERLTRLVGIGEEGKGASVISRFALLT